MKNLLSLLSDQISNNLGDCKRLLHGRGKKWDEFSHLSIDWYPPSVLITTYKEISQADKESLVNCILKLQNLDCQNILLQKRYLRGEAVEVLKGELLLESLAVENSEKYILNLKNPQNIGFFLDMSFGREWVKNHSQDKRVLNLFSYTCSLSISALKGGASEVLNLDMSKASLGLGEKNHTLNNVERKAKFIPYDIMNSFGNIKKKGPYDLVIIDPPTNQGDSFKVERDYYKILRKLGEMTNPNALIMACLNSPFLTSDFLLNGFKEHAPGFHFQEKVLSSFHEMESNPEEGLKILIFQKM